MGIFEKLGAFVRFGQLVGLFSYRIQKDEFSLKFERFTFSWLHPLTVWFFVVNIL